MQQTKVRNIALDITRIYAFFSVVAVHFFYNSDFYSASVSGFGMCAAIVVRTFFSACVPLFLLLSGYLLCRRPPIRNSRDLGRYLLKSGRIVGTYILSYIGIALFRRYCTAEEVGLRNALLQMFEFPQYGWYVNMYLGLYLLIPFLNVVWAGLEGKAARKSLLCSMFLLTILPTVLNACKFHGSFLKIIPDWWTDLVPITVYYIGAYIREYFRPESMNRGKILLLLLLCLAFGSGYTIVQSWGVPFSFGPWSENMGWIGIAVAVPVFLLLNSIPWPEPGKTGSRLLALVSELTLGAYLLSWVSDQLIYRQMKRLLPTLAQQFRFGGIAVLLSALLALLLSLGVWLTMKLSAALIRRCRKRLQPQPE